MICKDIVDVFNNVGILIDEEQDNFLFSDYIQDSLTFVTFIVEIESAFSIEVPDEYLIQEALSTYDDLVMMIKKAKSNLSD